MSRELFERYRRDRDVATRNKLVEAYRHLVHFIADRLYAHLAKQVELADVRQLGILGLMEAIEAFDLSRGIKFETYASIRIRGAILDGVRDLDYAPRLSRTREAIVGAARRRFEQSHARPPTSLEVRQLLSKEPNAEAILGDSEVPARRSIDWAPDAGMNGGGKQNQFKDIMPSARASNSLDRVMLHGWLRHALKGCDRAERLIVILYYIEDMSMKEIGVVIGLSESRISQMHTNLILRLRAARSQDNLN